MILGDGIGGEKDRKGQGVGGKQANPREKRGKAKNLLHKGEFSGKRHSLFQKKKRD